MIESRFTADPRCSADIRKASAAWRARRCLLCLAAIQLLLCLPAHAHPPYEHTARVVEGPNGPLSLVLVRTDGIVFTDPVGLEVRDSTGKTLSATEPAREIVLACWPFAECRVFRYDGLFPLLPEDVWALHGDRLVPVTGIAFRVLGVPLPLWDNWLGYIAAVVLGVLPFLALRNAHAAPEGTSRTVRVFLAGLGGTFVLLIWLYVVVLLSSLSLPLILLVGVVASAIYRAIGRRRSAPVAQGASQ